MRSRVRVLDVAHVLPAQYIAVVSATCSPEGPLRVDGHVKLSFMDALFIDRVPMRRLFFYEGPSIPPFPSLVRSLKSSLAAALAVFTPLAGKISHRTSTGDVFVDCSPTAVSPGVRFVEAEYAGTVDDMRRLAAGDEHHHPEALALLGPELSADRLPAPVLAVQVTRPAAVVVGGDHGRPRRRAVVLGVAIHHAVADGHSVWQFMSAWSALSRSPEEAAAASGLVPPPVFDRAAIRYPKADEVAWAFLRTIAPALPVVRSPSSYTPPDLHRISFLLRAGDIESVKQRIVAQSEAIGERLNTRPSTYVAVSSLVWTSIVRTKPADVDDPIAGAGADDACYLLVPADLRRRLGALAPGVDELYFGNCVAPCFARAGAGDLRDERAGLARAAAAIGDAVRARLEDPLGGAERWLERFLAAAARGRLTHMGSSNRFTAYATDFGWGKPSRVELVSLFARELVLLLGAEDGGVQVTVAMDHAHMEGFAANLMRP
ncbi:unnamed protein product [Urochloa humidicola]